MRDWPGLLERLSLPPEAWRRWTKIPWDEPEFSARMLEEHLSQEHDLASRTTAWIERGVQAIASLLPAQARVLDLCCGPGLYLNRLAERGFTGLGVDFSPASIGHARTHAPKGAEYLLGDVLTAEFGSGFDAVLFLFGELATFRPDMGGEILRRAAAATRPGGLLVAEVHRPAPLHAWSQTPDHWRTSQGGLFHPGPHLLFEQSHWWEAESAVAARTIVLAEYDWWESAQSTLALEQAQWTDLLASADWRVEAEGPPLGPGDAFVTLLARRGP